MNSLSYCIITLVELLMTIVFVLISPVIMLIMVLMFDIKSLKKLFEEYVGFLKWTGGWKDE